MTRPALLSLDDALPQLLAHARALSATQQVSTFEADGRVLAQDVTSALQVPPQDNSSMDGYAVRAADCAQANALLRVTQRIPAGTHGTQLNAGEAARIFTGAPIPPGADAVVMQEDCEALDSDQVKVTKAVPLGQWIRRSGEDVTRGATVLTQGTRLTPAELGLAAWGDLQLQPILFARHAATLGLRGERLWHRARQTRGNDCCLARCGPAA